MRRRTVLKLAAGVAGAVTVGASVRPEAAMAAGSIIEVGGWPKHARIAAIATGRSGTWVTGMEDLREFPGDWRRRPILRKLRQRTWQPVALPDSFAAWATALAPDAAGVWVAGDRNDVTLPVSDGTAAVGHLGHDGKWRALDTEKLPRYARYASVLLIDGRLELTGERPHESGPGFSPYCVSRPLGDASAGWTERPITPDLNWIDGPLPTLKIGSGTTDWATAGSRLLRRTGSGWTVVDGPPGSDETWLSHCAVSGRSLYLITVDSGKDWSVRLHRRVNSTWTDVPLPKGMRLHQLAATANGCWAVGSQEESNVPVAASAIRIAGSKIIQRVDGRQGMIELVCIADGKVLLGGVAPDPDDPDNGWAGYGWLLRP